MSKIESKKETKKQQKVEKSKLGKIIIILVIIITVILVVTGIYMYHNITSNKTIHQQEIERIRAQNESALIEYNEPIEYMTVLTYDEMTSKLVDQSKLQDETCIEVYINGQRVSEEDQIKFENVGETTIETHLRKNYKYKLIKEHTTDIENYKKLSIMVQDTIIPILNGVSDKNITVGDELNVLDGITATDEREGELTPQFEGEVDTSKEGAYTVKIFATDKNGNKAEQQMTVNVKAKEISKNENNDKSTSTNNSSNKKSDGSTSSKASGGSNNQTSGSSGGQASNSGNKSTDSGTGTQANSSAQDETSTKSGRLQIAQREAKKVAGRIFKAGMSDLEKAQAIAEYLCSNVDRQLDQSNEAYKTNYGNEAYAAFVLKKAACSGFCKAAIMLCEQAGIQCKHINANQWTHQWLEVYIDGRWVEMDPQLGAVFY